MADIVDSREKKGDELMPALKRLVSEVNGRFQNKILSPLTITLGDEFQGIVSDVSTGAEIIIFLKEELIVTNPRFTLRYVLHEGEIDTPINSLIAYEMLGSGLTDARTSLNLSKNSPKNVKINLIDKNTSIIIEEAFNIIEEINKKWNLDRDAELIYNLIKLIDYKLVANRLHKDRSLIWKREKNLMLEAYYSAKNIISELTKSNK